MADNKKISVTRNGPYIVTGGVPLTKGAGSEVYPTPETYALCRCGKSKKKPFCDGSHVTEHFEGEV